MVGWVWGEGFGDLFLTSEIFSKAGYGLGVVFFEKKKIPPA